MYVRLNDSPRGLAGKWTDAATGEHGDLLDVIRESCGLVDFKDVADEARTFLSMLPPEPEPRQQYRQSSAPHGSPEAARRLFAISQPITGTLVHAYLRERGILDLRGTQSLRFHPRCYYRPDEHSPTETWPAMIAAVTDFDGRITGAHRTWLDPRRPREQGSDRHTTGRAHGRSSRQRGPLRDRWRRDGSGRRHRDRTVDPAGPSRYADAGGTLGSPSRRHPVPHTLRRLYIVRDNDPAGDGARDTLIDRANEAGIEAIVLSPELGDFNEDLLTHGIDALRTQARLQVAPEDVARFMALAA